MINEKVTFLEEIEYIVSVKDKKIMGIQGR